MTVMERAEAALERWEDIDFTRALRAVSPRRVRREAAGIDRDPAGDLVGLCCSVKDILPVAGVESCAGSTLLVGRVPRADPPLIAALRRAGALVVGKGVCAEFGFGLDVENRLDGRVTHPLDPTISPGGSSGGDAVAVGAGVVDFAVAGDYGGSVRWPAQAMEVLGLRCGIGTTPQREQIAAPTRGLQSRLDAPGLLARDPAVLRRVLRTLEDEAGAGAPSRRLLIAAPDVLGAVAPAVTAAVEDIARRADRAGFELVDACPAVSATLAEAWSVYRRLRELTDGHDGVRALVAGREAELTPSSAAVLAASTVTTAAADPAEVAELEARERLLRDRFRGLVRGVDALVLPVAPHGAIGFGERVEIDGTAYDAAGLHSHLRAVSLSGLPALSMPVGAHVSVQLVSAAGGQQLLCAVAEELLP